MTASDLILEAQIEESYRLLVHLSESLPELRKTNDETGKPAWTDRTGDYQKNLDSINKISEKLLADYSARVGKPELMKHLFGVDL